MVLSFLTSKAHDIVDPVGAVGRSFFPCLKNFASYS